MTEPAFDNSLRLLLALGGSTNAIIHLTAIAGRLGIEISLRRLNELSDSTPVLVDLKPTGVGYMEDLHAAGGIQAVLRELRHLLHLDCITVTGETIGDQIERAPSWVDRGIIKSFAEPLRENGGLVALFGNVALPRRDPQMLRRRSKNSLNARAARSSLSHLRIRRSASTIPRSTSRRTIFSS